MNTETREGHKAEHKNIEVRVRYIGAHKPFVAPHATFDETLASLKQRALSFFGLVEGAVVNGTKVYTFVHGDVELTDLSQTLGQLSTECHEIKLDLLEQFEQG